MDGSPVAFSSRDNDRVFLATRHLDTKGKGMSLITPHICLAKG
jgi:hypothetical protein